MEIFAIIIISIWVLIGMIGILRCKENRVNIEMLIFFFSAPFLVFIKYLL